MHRRLIDGLVLAGALSIALVASAQRFTFEHIDADRGLPASFVLQIEQDELGNLWFVTMDGLSRWDGREFTNFGTETAMRDQRLASLARAADGRFFFGHASGVSIWDGRLVRNLSEEDGLGRGTVWAIAVEPNGRAWVGTQAGGLSSIDGDVIRTFTTNDGIPSNYVYALRIDSSGRLWIGGREKGVALAEIGADGTIEIVQKWSTDEGLLSPVVRAFLEEPDGSMLVGTRGGGIWRIAPDRTLSRVAPQLPSGDVYSLRFGRSGNLLVGLLGGGARICYPPAYERCLTLDTESGLESNAVTSVMEDREGSIWVGTTSGALRMAGHQFVSYGRPEGLSADFAFSIAPDRDGSIWVSSLSGITRLELGERMRSSVKTTTLTTEDGLPTGEVWDALRDSRGNLWLATSAGLCLWNERSGCRTFGPDEGLTSRLCLALLEDRDGSVWVSTRNGVSKLRQTLTPRDRTITELSALESLEMASMSQATDGAIWFAGPTAVARFDNGVWSTWHTGPELGVETVSDVLALEDGSVWFSTSGEGLARFEPSMEGSGRGILKAFGKESGLSSLSFRTLVDDENGMIWAGSASGLFQVDPGKAGSKGFVVRHYTMDDGLASQEPTGPNAFARSARGDLWFGFTGAATRYIPAADAGQHTNAVEPLVVIKSIHAAEAEIYAAPFTTMVASNGEKHDPVVAVPFGKRSLSIGYGAAVMKGNRRLAYQVRLDGYDQGWSAPTSRNSKEYTKLPPGNYVFRVRARIGSNAWGKEAALPLTVPALVWETIWFRGLLVVVALLILVTIHHLRTLSIRNRNLQLAQIVADRTHALETRTRELEETNIEFEHANVELETVNRLVMEADRAKSRFLASMSHELRTPLNSIIGFTDLMIDGASRMDDQKRERFLRNVRHSATVLLGLINDILDISKIEAGRMEVHIDKISVKDVVEEVAETMRGSADPRGTEIVVNCDETLKTAYVDPVKVRQILQNLLSNAIKYSDDGARVVVSARHADEGEAGLGQEAFEIAVSDNGQGIPADQLPGIFEEYRQALEDSRRGMGTGLGLAIVRKFSELQGGRVTVESEIGVGSTFRVWLPVDARHWDTEKPS